MKFMIPNLTSDDQRLLACAFEAAEAAYAIISAKIGTTFERQEKGQANFVTEVDRACETAIRSVLVARYPDDGFVGEEAQHDSLGINSRHWIVDPIDGTTNFIKGIPWYSVSIALYDSDGPLLGLVMDAAHHEFYYALSGQGAWHHKDGLVPHRLSVSPAKTMAESVLATGFYYDRGEHMRKTLAQIETFFEDGMICMRRFGSAALDLCMVAAGHVEGFWEHVLNPWDFAAGILLVTEAGGQVSDWQGKPMGLVKGPILAACPAIHPLILRRLGTNTSPAG